MRKFDLKPCPFCGDPNPQVVWDSGDEDKLGVKCFNCGGCIDTEKDTAEEAVEAWNNRVIDLVDLEGYSDKLWRAAYERGKADRPRGEWINIEEEPPIDSESVVVSVYFPDYGDTILAIGHYSPRFDQWRLYSDREGEIRSGYKVIAWMPLPEPYEAKESE